jgi:hypothetical protein
VTVEISRRGAVAWTYLPIGVRSPDRAEGVRAPPEDRSVVLN